MQVSLVCKPETGQKNQQNLADLSMWDLKKMARVTSSCSLYLTILFSCLPGAEETCLCFCKNALLGEKWKFMLCECFPLMWYIWWKINCIRLNKRVFSSGSETWTWIIKDLKYLWWTSNLNLLVELEFMLSLIAASWSPLCKEWMRQVTRPRSNLVKNSPSLSSCLNQSLWNKMYFQ